MSNYTIHTLAESQLTLSNGAVLDGVTQGDGSHLVGETITLNSNAWETVAIADGGTDANFADNDANQTLDGAQTIFGTLYAGGTRVEAEYTLTVEDPDGNTYTLIAFNVVDSVPSYATVEGLAFLGSFPPRDVPLTVTGAAEGPSDSGAGSTPAVTYATPPCFAAGTRIETAAGPRRIETLRPGDLVSTRDDGPQPLRLRLATALPAAQLAACPAQRPVRIRAGALRPGVPARDILVSPQHRVLIDDWRAELYFGTEAVLVAARHLAGLPGIAAEVPPGGVVYHHLVFDRHRIVAAHGLMSESFHPGEATLAGVSGAMRAAFFARFPHLRGALHRYGPAARPALKGHEARLLAVPAGPVPAAGPRFREAA